MPSTWTSSPLQPRGFGLEQHRYRIERVDPDATLAPQERHAQQQHYEQELLEQGRLQQQKLLL